MDRLRPWLRNRWTRTGPGLLFFFTAWPAIGCLAVGAIRTWGKRREP